jgi:hypothetical protein
LKDLIKNNELELNNNNNNKKEIELIEFNKKLKN